MGNKTHTQKRTHILRVPPGARGDDGRYLQQHVLKTVCLLVCIL